MRWFEFYPSNFKDDFIQIVDSKKKIALSTPQRYFLEFGERNSDDELDGRGITIYEDGGILIGYRKDCEGAAGNYIEISP